VHGFWKAIARIFEAVWLTDIEGRALGAGLYLREEVAWFQWPRGSSNEEILIARV
jgi:hypothetical protein